MGRELHSSVLACRIQGSIKSYSANDLVLLRVFLGYAQQADCVPDMHDRQYAETTGALYRVGFGAGMAAGTRG